MKRRGFLGGLLAGALSLLVPMPVEAEAQQAEGSPYQKSVYDGVEVRIHQDFLPTHGYIDTTGIGVVDLRSPRILTYTVTEDILVDVANGISIRKT